MLWNLDWYLTLFVPTGWIEKKIKIGSGDDTACQAVAHRRNQIDIYGHWGVIIAIKILATTDIH